MKPISGSICESGNDDVSSLNCVDRDVEDNVSELCEIANFYETMSIVDILEQPRRETCQGPEGNIFGKNLELFQNPCEWHMNPLVATEPRYEDALCEQLGDWLRGLQLEALQASSKFNSKVNQTCELNGEDDAVWNEKYASLNLAGVTPCNSVFYKTRSRSKEIADMVCRSLPARSVGVPPGSYCQENVLLYVGIIRKINKLESLRRKDSKKRRFSHYFDTVCLDFDSSFFVDTF